MTIDKLRQSILCEAARLLHQRQESDFGRAKIRAARRLCRNRLKPAELPTNGEIREQLKRLANVYDEYVPGFEAMAEEDAPAVDPFSHYRNLLVPLAKIQQNRQSHPEGDVLYHSLQVFELAREHVSYDEEFLLAALLHDVGKGIDPYDHVEAGLRALGDTISERTAGMIEHHPLATQFLAGSIGIRARRRLQSDEDFDELMLLAKCDAAGRRPGAIVPDLDEALGYVRELSGESDEWS